MPTEEEKNRPWLQSKSKELLKIFLMLKTEDEVKIFLRDLLTEKEIEELGMRWHVAKMLDQGIPFSQIEKETGMTPGTIARISKWLKEGSGGYRLVIDRLKVNTEI